MAERRIRDWIKMIFLCAYMREGWRFKETAPDSFELSIPHHENRTYYADIKISPVQPGKN